MDTTDKTVHTRRENAEDLRLMDKVGELSHLFDDVLFRKGTATNNLVKIRARREDGVEVCIDDGLPYEIDSFTYDWFCFKVEDLGEAAGQFDSDTQTLSVSPAHFRDNVILHEMIHLHETAVNAVPSFFHDMILWTLYIDLWNKIDDLDSIVSEHAHLLNERALFEDGGVHDLLFLLKSFDLDLKMEYPLGTVFGYGLQDKISQEMKRGHR